MRDPEPRLFRTFVCSGPWSVPNRVREGILGWIGRPGGGRLSRVLRRSTMGAGGFHGRVREGIGCGPPAKATRSSGPSRARHRQARALGRADRVPVRVVRCVSSVPPLVPGSGACQRSVRVVSCRTARFSHRGLTPWRAPAAISVHGLNPSLSGDQNRSASRVAPFPHPACRRDGLSRPSGRSRFEVGFPLRCFQRLSRPYLATRPCHWRDNRCTRGMFIPVLSY